MAGCGLSALITSVSYNQLVFNYIYGNGGNTWEFYKGGYEQNENKMIVLKG